MCNIIIVSQTQRRQTKNRNVNRYTHRDKEIVHARVRARESVRASEQIRTGETHARTLTKLPRALCDFARKSQGLHVTHIHAHARSIQFLFSRVHALALFDLVFSSHHRIREHRNLTCRARVASSRNALPRSSCIIGLRSTIVFVQMHEMN